LDLCVSLLDASEKEAKMSYGILLLRIVVGVAFVGHGTQKLFGWFGGYGPKGTGGFFGSQGFRAPVLMAVAAGLAEAGGGTLLALGLVTPLAGALLATVMINAIAAVTFKKAFMLGSELEIAYLTIAVSLAATGPGRFSIDRAIGWDDNISGVWWGVGALGAALAVSFLTLTVGRTRAMARQEPAAQT
jgi:putative oxidoreductase